MTTSNFCLAWPGAHCYVLYIQKCSKLSSVHFNMFVARVGYNTPLKEKKLADLQFAINFLTCHVSVICDIEGQVRVKRSSESLVFYMSLQNRRPFICTSSPFFHWRMASFSCTGGPLILRVITAYYERKQEKLSWWIF